MIEIHYPEFLKILRVATDTNKKIDKTDKEAWAAFVKKHKVPEAGFAVHAKAGAMSGKLRSVIIDGAGEADGYYMYSPDDQFCLKYEVGEA
jgi:hypothetical protein